MAAELRAAATNRHHCGALLGLREALVTLEANAFAPPNYWLLFLSVPLLAWIALAVALLTPVALAMSLRRIRPGSSPAPAVDERTRAAMRALGYLR